jgi:signal transduction histidine kinase
MGLKDLPIVKLYERLSMSGIDENTPEQVRKHVILTNNINLTVLTLIIPYGILFSALGLAQMGILLCSFFFLFAFFHYLNSEGYFLLARTLILISLNVILCSYAVALGRQAGLHFLYVVFFTLPVLLFEPKNYIHMVLGSIASVVGFLIVRLDVFPPVLTPSAQVLQIISLSIIGLTFVWLFLNKYYLMRANHIIEESLRAKNLELKEEILRRQKAEETLKQSYQLLKQKNKELEELTYVTSHDLQEPLRTIASYVDLLATDYEHKVDDKGKLYMRFIVQSTGRLKKLIKDLLEYTLLGRHSAFTTINTNEIIKELQEDLSLFIKENNTALIIQPLPVIKANANDIKLLFLNLIVNGIKFKHPNRPPVIKISGQEKEAAWLFSISDNGIGIEKKFLQKIFVIFQRLHSKDAYEGNGIGLAHCKKIVEMHGGNIWVESEEGKGSTFYFTLNKNHYDTEEEN